PAVCLARRDGRRAPGGATHPRPPRPPAPPPPAAGGLGGPPAVTSAWKASPRAISSSPFRPGSRKHRRPQGSRSPTASRGTSWRERDGGLEPRDGGLKRRFPARPRGREIGARGGAPPQRAAPFPPPPARGRRYLSLH